MGQTTNYQLPYPELGDTADVPRDVKALAVKLDGFTSIRPPVVTSLPGSPVDGQQVLYRFSTASGAGVWHLVYDAGWSADAYKWHVLGGPSLFNAVPAVSTMASTTWAEFPPGGGPGLVLPLPGVYDFEYGARIWADANAAAVTRQYGLAPVAGTPAAGEFIDYHWPNAQAPAYIIQASSFRKTLATAASILTLGRVAAGPGVIGADGRWARGMPARVG